MARRKKRTIEEVDAQIADLQQEKQQIEALKTLPGHEGVKKLNKSVLQAVQETGAEELNVRIAELMLSSMDLVEFYRGLKNPVDEWMSDNATYRNPDNPEDFWYSPDGKGTPPKWLVALVGAKPKTKKPSDMDDWLKKAEKYKVNTEEEKKAA
jgi:hypothetical protein